MEGSEEQAGRPYEWKDVLSPKVGAIINDMTGRPITPESFRTVMQRLQNELTPPERLEFLMIQMIYGKAGVQ